MKEATAQQHIDAAPQEVFHQATRLQEAAGIFRNIERLEVLTGGPVGRGTRYRETRWMFGREGTEEMEITEFDPPHGYTVETESHGNRVRSRFAFRPSGDGGTEATISCSVEPTSRTGKLLGGAVMPWMRRSLVKALQADLADLKRAVESR